MTATLYAPTAEELASLPRVGEGQVVYIAGPISGMGADWKKPFLEAEGYFLRLGWDVINPATMGEEFGFDTTLETLRKYLNRDIKQLVFADAIAMLPGWHLSKGANAELAVARMMGLTVFTFARFPIDEHYTSSVLPKQSIIDLVVGGLTT